MANYFIACDTVPTESNNGASVRCRYSEGAIVYSELQVSEIYSPAMTVEEANWIGLMYMSVWFAAYLGKKAASTIDLFSNPSD